MEALIEAANILITARKQNVNQPLPIWQKNAHAVTYIEKQISELLAE